MRERGLLVRDALPESILSAIAARFPDLEVEGKDGMGPKSRAPWVRVFDRARSPTPRQGWYAVYLVHEGATGVTLSLNQGTTRFSDGNFVALPPELLAKRVEWARERLRGRAGANIGFSTPALGAGKLAKGYERGHVLGVTYATTLPSEQTLVRDLFDVLELLLHLHDTETLAPPPGAPDPSIAAILAEIDTVAGKNARGGAPRRQSAGERKAIERLAMIRARELLEKLGWSVVDTHLTEPYDFRASTKETEIYVEVKGTTTSGDSVILTRNEVRHHRQHPGSSALVVVRDILMIPDEAEPTCTGGIAEIWLPWEVEEKRLSPLAYEYLVPRENLNAIRPAVRSRARLRM